MTLTTASMLHLLLLLLLLSSSDQSVVAISNNINDNIDFASGRIDARVPIPEGTAHVRAYPAAENKEILKNIQLNSSSHRFSQLKWYTPGYLTVLPHLSSISAHANRNSSLRNFFKVHKGKFPYLEMKVSLISDEILQSLADEATYSYMQNRNITNRQIYLMELTQITCDCKQLNLKFKTINTQRHPYRLRTIDFNLNSTEVQSFVEKYLNTTETVQMNCKLKFGSMEQLVSRLLDVDDLTEFLQLRLTQISIESRDSYETLNNLKEMNNSISQLESYLGFTRHKRGIKDFKTVKVDNRTFIVFQQRRSNSVTFTQKWRDYETGFGDDQNFWMGLANIAALTIDSPRTMRVEMETFNGSRYALEYEGFQVLGTNTNYRMAYSRMKPHPIFKDGLKNSKNQQFSTEFIFSSMHTYRFVRYKNHYQGGWWYNPEDFFMNPNGNYYNSVTGRWHGIVFDYVLIPRKEFSVKSTRLMLEALTGEV